MKGRIRLDLTLVLNQMIILLILIAIGFIAKKLKVITENGDSSISKLVINVTHPALILNSVFSGRAIENKAVLLTVFIAAAAYYLFSFVFAKAVVSIFRVKEKYSGAFQCMLSFGNISFMGIPVLRAVFPENQDTAILYQSIFVIFFNLFIFTYGIYLIGKSEKTSKTKFSPKSFLNAGTVSSVLAVILYFFDIRPPEIITSALKSIGDVTTPLAMILIGSSLASFSMLGFLKHIRNYALTALKLLVMPAIVWIVSKYIIDDFLIRGVLTIVSAMPVATLTIMLSNQYGKEKEFVPQGVFMTTVFSVLTIPLTVFVLFNF